MGSNGRNGSEYPSWPVPIGIIELYEESLDTRVKNHLAELFHDGSRKFVPFRGMMPTESKKYTKKYIIPINDKFFKAVRVDLIFDYRDEKRQIGYIRVSEKGRELLRNNNIIDVKEENENGQTISQAV